MSTNPYKGVPGGDPRFRAEARKPVKTQYVCAECGKDAYEMLFEGKDTTGRKCIDCRNRESAEKQEANRIESEKRLTELRQERLNRPQRKDEEKAALLEEFADAPRHGCDSCGEQGFIWDENLPFKHDDFWRENSIRVVSYRPDPFQVEIYDNHDLHWFCGSCHQLAANEI